MGITDTRSEIPVRAQVVGALTKHSPALVVVEHLGVTEETVNTGDAKRGIKVKSTHLPFQRVVAIAG